MDKPRIFKSIKELRPWIKRLDFRARNAVYFARRVHVKSKAIMIFTRPRADVAPDDYEHLLNTRLFPVTLPTVEKANDWWWDIWEGLIIDFRRARASHDTYYCIACSAVWESLPEFFLEVEKSAFKIVDEEIFARDLGPPVLNEMIMELSLGLSIRRKFNARKTSAGGR